MNIISSQVNIIARLSSFILYIMHGRFIQQSISFKTNNIFYDGAAKKCFIENVDSSR